MATVTIRNLDDAVVEKLRSRARDNHRSLEAELRELLSGVVREQERMRKFQAKAARIAAMTPGKLPQSDSTRLLREDRRR
jgi:plasmid stability protein